MAANYKRKEYTGYPKKLTKGYYPSCTNHNWMILIGARYQETIF